MEDMLLDLLARIDDGDAEALDELKRLKKYISELNDMLSVVDDEDDIHTIKTKFDALSDKFEEFLMAVVKVVG
uniref:Uncharacterized protein n=1 Tax=uncultured euryarchaeote Alv-FOS1 TaxID=337892 RepID=Q3SAC9_9EURY|nr:hypothetical protein [uncultured euryarchaeote Alv-FOS1]